MSKDINGAEFAVTAGVSSEVAQGVGSPVISETVETGRRLLDKVGESIACLIDGTFGTSTSQSFKEFDEKARTGEIKPLMD